MALREIIARSIWVTAWMSYEEESGGTSIGPGVEIFDVAPPVIQDAYDIADRFLIELERLNGAPVEQLYQRFRFKLLNARANERGIDHGAKIDEAAFGHYLVMEAEHHGVGLWEWVKDHGIKIPSLECLDAFFDEDSQRMRMDGPWYNQPGPAFAEGQ